MTVETVEEILVGADLWRLPYQGQNLTVLKREGKDGFDLGWYEPPVPDGTARSKWQMQISKELAGRLIKSGVPQKTAGGLMGEEW